MKSIIKQFLRYGIVGGLALGVDIGSFLALRGMGLGLVDSNVLARLAGALAAHGGNHRWTFNRPFKLDQWKRSAWRYTTLWIGATLLSTVLLSTLTKLGAGETASKLGVEILIMMLNFLLSRHWVYR